MFQPRTALIALAASGALLLSGCGTGSPGAAVKVDDRTVSMAAVDRAVETMCSKKVSALWLQGGQVTNGSQRAQVAIGLAFSSLADKFAREHDVDEAALARTLGPARSEIRGLVGDVDDETEESLLAQQKLFAVRDLVGRDALEAEGGEVSDEAATARGTEMLQDWIGGQDVSFDPRLGISLVDGQVSLSEGTASFPVSEIAKAGSAQEPAAEYVGALPENQRCG